MTSRTRTRCSGCGKRIPASEPDLVLQKHGSERQRFYHQRCIDATRRLIISDPAVWHLVSRYVAGKLN